MDDVRPGRLRRIRGINIEAVITGYVAPKDGEGPRGGVKK